MNKVIIIYGPTAVGKSGVAVELAKIIDGEIISADSMQIYKHLNIGTAKISSIEQQGVRHYLLDVLEPSDSYSVFDFCEMVNKLIPEILSRNKTPIIVGGTGLYIKALIEGYNFADCNKDDGLRELLSGYTAEELKNKLNSLNLKSSIDLNNKKRIIRAIEIASSGGTIANKKFKYDYMLFGIYDEREKIYDRINKRVDIMINSGLLEEAKYLKSLNLPSTNQCIKAIGYKELFPYIDGQQNLEDCISILKQKTRNYAKRQITFLNQFKNITMVKFNNAKDTAEEIKKYL